MDFQFTSVHPHTHISSIKFCISLHSPWLTHTTPNDVERRENSQNLCENNIATMYCIHHLMSGNEFDSRMWKMEKVFMHSCMQALKSVIAKAKPMWIYRGRRRWRRRVHLLLFFSISEHKSALFRWKTDVSNDN